MGLHTKTTHQLVHNQKALDTKIHELTIQAAQKSAKAKELEKGSNFFTKTARSIIHDTVTTFSKSRINKEIATEAPDIQKQMESYQTAMDYLSDTNHEKDLEKISKNILDKSSLAKDSPEYLGLLRYCHETFESQGLLTGNIGNISISPKDNADEVYKKIREWIAKKKKTSLNITEELKQKCDFEKYVSEYAVLRDLPSQSSDASFSIDSRGKIKAKTSITEIGKKIGGVATNIGTGLATKVVLGAAGSMLSLSGVGLLAFIGGGYAVSRGFIKYYQEGGKEITTDDFAPAFLQSMESYFDEINQPTIKAIYTALIENKAGIPEIIEHIESCSDTNELQLLYHAFGEMKKDSLLSKNFAMKLTLDNLGNTIYKKWLEHADESTLKVTDPKDVFKLNLQRSIATLPSTNHGFDTAHMNKARSKINREKALLTAGTSLLGYGTGAALGAVGQQIFSFSPTGTKEVVHDEVLAVMKASKEAHEAPLIASTPGEQAKEALAGFKNATSTQTFDFKDTPPTTDLDTKLGTSHADTNIPPNDSLGKVHANTHYDPNDTYAKHTGQWLRGAVPWLGNSIEGAGLGVDTLSGSPLRWLGNQVEDLYEGITGNKSDFMEHVNIPTGFNFLKSLVQDAGKDELDGISPLDLNPIERGITELWNNFPQRAFQGTLLLIAYMSVRNYFPKVKEMDKKMLGYINDTMDSRKTVAIGAAIDPVTTGLLYLTRKIGQYTITPAFNVADAVGEFFSKKLPNAPTAAATPAARTP